MQRYTMIFITRIALHVSGGSPAHHQELKTVHTALVICQAPSASYHYRELEHTPTHSRSRVYSFELLMMGGGTA